MPHPAGLDRVRRRVQACTASLLYRTVRPQGGRRTCCMRRSKIAAVTPILPGEDRNQAQSGVGEPEK